MMSETYDREIIRGYFDALADEEWARLEANAEGRVSFYLHRSYLREFIAAGAEVLEVGAGPGRFTLELAALGARVTVGDVSRVQLELNRARVAEAGCEAAVVARKVLDIVDLSDLTSEQFDAVVAYGGPLSYVMERADEALAELLRVTKRGGYLLLSVMSLVGATRKFSASVIKWARAQSRGSRARHPHGRSDGRHCAPASLPHVSLGGTGYVIETPPVYTRRRFGRKLPVGQSGRAAR
jgi:SAM-dependent methyltransferase